MKMTKLSNEQFETRLELGFTVLEWIGIIVNLCLALRHPQNIGHSRPLVIAITRIVEDTLLAQGFADQEDIALIHQTERNFRRFDYFYNLN